MSARSGAIYADKAPDPETHIPAIGTIATRLRNLPKKLVSASESDKSL